MMIENGFDRPGPKNPIWTQRRFLSPLFSHDQILVDLALKLLSGEVVSSGDRLRLSKGLVAEELFTLLQSEGKDLEKETLFQLITLMKVEDKRSLALLEMRKEIEQHFQLQYDTLNYFQSEFFDRYILIHKDSPFHDGKRFTSLINILGKSLRGDTSVDGSKYISRGEDRRRLILNPSKKIAIGALLDDKYDYVNHVDNGSYFDFQRMYHSESIQEYVTESGRPVLTNEELFGCLFAFLAENMHIQYSYDRSNHTINEQSVADYFDDESSEDAEGAGDILRALFLLGFEGIIVHGSDSDSIHALSIKREGCDSKYINDCAETFTLLQGISLEPTL